MGCAPLPHPRDARGGAPGPGLEALGAALAARHRAVRGGLVATGRVPRAGPRARRLDPVSARPQGRRGRTLVARAARDGRRARSSPRRVAACDRLPRARSARARPGAAARYVVAPRRPAARANGLRPPPDRARRARTPAGEALVHQHRLRAGAPLLLDLGAVLHLHGRARLSGRSHQPAPRARAARAPRGDRRAPPTRPRRRAPGGDIPLRLTRAGGDRSVRGPASAGRGR